jgi:hypothetical protein
MLQSACEVASVGSDLADWQQVALRTQLPAALDQVKVTHTGVDERAMAACRIVAASDAAALRRCDGGRRPLPPAGEQIALKIASAMVAIALSAFPEPTEEEEESPEGLAADEVLADGGTALARAFLAHKREVCAQSLAALAERIRGVKSGHARSELRGVSKAKQGAGVRRRSAKRGGAGAKERPKSAGFG